MEIQTICTAMILKLGYVNCYLAHTPWGHILIDTAGSNQRGRIEKELLDAGCQPGKLLIVITHGDYDHTGNAAYFRQRFSAQIAIHPGDVDMLARGDMFANRKKGNPILRGLAKLLLGFGKSQQCAPDILLQDGMSLAEFGWDARIVSIPGHSSGSIGVLNAEGDLFCGDLFENVKKPAFNSIMDDLDLARASLKKLRDLGAIKAYPGHGSPFLLKEIVDSDTA